MLTFQALRLANEARCMQFRDAQGRLCHPEGVKHWSPAQWLMAVTGELGELANLLKKIERGDFPLHPGRELADELADVVTYLDLLASRLGVNLGDAVLHKFNRVSERVGATVYLDAYSGEPVSLLSREPS